MDTKLHRYTQNTAPMPLETFRYQDAFHDYYIYSFKEKERESTTRIIDAKIIAYL